VVKIILGVKLSSLKFLSLLKKEDPGLVLANGLFAAFYILPAVILSGRKLIVIQHLIFNEKAIEKKIIKLAYRFSEKIVCVSYAVKNNLSSMLNWTEKLIIIPNGIRVKDTPESFSNKTGSIKFGVIGSIIRIKGIDLILKVMVDFLKSGKVELHIFGKTSDNTDSANYKNEIMNIIEKYGIAERVIFHGHIESKFDIYSRVNVVINYSTVPESFSYSVLEAMAHKKIVIAANAGGPKEIINDGENGFLVETQNLNQLKSKTEYCIENFYSDKFQLIREKAFETVKNNYSIEKFSKDYSKLFHSLID
jgi:glycosyltransferase involved in cell wall biosynthesis